MVLDMIIGSLGGLGLFLYGMTLMSVGLKKVAGQKLKGILKSMTQRRIMGFLVGAGVTDLIQSSSAATVMVIGFVNAGLLTLKQAISVIIGTNLGTTATAWLVAMSGLHLKTTTYALPAVAIGFGLSVIGRRQNLKDVGQVLLGFGILFIGIVFMKDAFAGLEQSDKVTSLFIKAADNPFLAIMAGALVTVLIQSSSAAVASIQLLALSGAFGSDWTTALQVAIPFILGSNIGTTITAQLAAFQANLNSRRAAWAHTMFNVIGAFICYWLIGLFVKLVNIAAGPSTIVVSIAIAHTMIKLFEAALFLPFTGMLERMVVWMNPEKEKDIEARPVVLEEHLLNTPVIAMEQVKHEIVRMASVACRAVNQAVEGLDEDDVRKLDSARKSEDAVDEFQYEITSYVATLSTKELSDDLSVVLPVMLHTVNDLERVGDHAVNIAEIAERKIRNRILFSDSAQSEAKRLKSEVNEMFSRISAALKDNDIEVAKSALENEAALNKMQVDFRRSHVQRMTDGRCSPQSGLIFIDLVDNIEKIGDHLTNIAQAVIGGLQWDGVEQKAEATD